MVNGARGTLGRILGSTMALALLGVSPALVEGQADRSALVTSLDSAAHAWVGQPGVAGISVAVVQGGDTLLMGGYGFVDLEWEVATPRDGSATYETGSITKQFTSAAIMQLVEQGLIDLDADFTEYLDFDTQGRSVPVRRLLDHTSGIRSYTEMSALGELAPFKLPRDTLVRLVEDVPFDFEPGTAMIYNNSAYYFLGLIIEKISGQSYEDYLAEYIFGPVGMADSYYCSESAIRGQRAHGYDAGPDGLQRKGYLDHTWPFAAGSVCSSVGDMIAWNQALHGGRIVSRDSYRAMTTPAPLVDGTPTRYAMGLGVDAPGGRRIIAHGGGINGFVSDGRYYPDEELTIVVLQNSTGASVGMLGGALADLVLGPLAEPESLTYSGDLEEFAGTYSGPARGNPMTVVVSVEDGSLTLQPSQGPAMHPGYRGDLTWSQGALKLTFVRESGVINALRVDQGGGHYVLSRTGG